MAHSQASFPAMTTSRDVPNPLRPYYVPPSIGLPPDVVGNTTTSSAAAAAAASSSARGSIGSSARDIFSEFDYGGPLFDTDSPSVAEMGKKIMDQALWKYTSVLLAQPFDVAKTVLQVRLAATQQAQDAVRDLKRRQSQRYSDSYYTEPSASESESDQDEPSYFTPTKPSRHEDSTLRKSRSRRRTPSRSDTGTPISASSSYSNLLNIRRSDSIIDALSQLWQHSGATGLWRATNATFIYNLLVKAIESWTRSLLSALCNLPDPAALSGNPTEVVAGAMGGLDLADSPSPMTSLAIAVASAAIAGLLLAPLDLIRTRLILTPTTYQPRAIVPLLRQLPSLTIPSSLLPATLLHSSLPTFITSSTPLILRQYLHIDPLTTPASYSLATFGASVAELFLKLPLETVLRRGQVHVLRSQHARQYSNAQYNSFRSNSKLLTPDMETIVEPGPYKGLFGTMWHVACEEGIQESGSGSKSVASTPVKASSVQAQRRQKKGQGVSGLWRGWRVGMWGLVGVWGASALGSGGKTEF